MRNQIDIGVLDLPVASHVTDFDRWWAEYPRKVSKGTARRAYGTAKRKVSAEMLLEGLRRYKFAPEAIKQPHASTWLNGERWADEPEPDMAADPWGLKAWHAAGKRGLIPEGYEEILNILEVPETSRPDLDIIESWYTERYNIAQIPDFLHQHMQTERIRTLKYADMLVRQRIQRFEMMQGGWVDPPRRRSVA